MYQVNIFNKKTDWFSITYKNLNTTGKTIYSYKGNNINTRCCTLRRAKNTPTRSFVSNLYISQHSLPENGSQTNLKHRALHKTI